MLLTRARAVVDVASDGPSNSAIRRDEIFLVRVLDCGYPAALRLAASTNAFDLAVDVCVFFIKTLLRYRRRRVNIGRARLAVAYRRRPGSGCSFESSL